MGFSLKSITRAVVGAVGVIGAPFTGGASLALTAGALANKGQEDVKNNLDVQQDVAMHINSVNELKGVYLAQMNNDASAPEWLEFLEYAQANPENESAVKIKGEETVKKYQDRLKVTGQSTFDTNSPNLLNSLSSEFYNRLIQETQTLKNAVNSAYTTDKKETVNPAVYAVGAVLALIGFIIVTKKGK